LLESEPAEPSGRIARYALGSDYHRALRARLHALAADLRAQGVGAGETAYVDDRPLAERAYAARAGLGWIGKNTNLLTHSSAGSWVFLGAIMTSTDLPSDIPIRSSCGSCTRCLGGCPTGALVAPRTIDARRCISYLTIEHPGVLERAEASAIGDWIFGCDVCQEVCPWNHRALPEGDARFSPRPLSALTPAEVARLAPAEFDQLAAGMALARARYDGLRRNALYAIGTARDQTARETVAKLVDDPAPVVSDAARWALERLDGAG
jgi:epoxyqueuosine reductase